MYKRHICHLIIVFAIAFFLSMVMELQYSLIAEETITVISIAIAICITISSTLLGSDYSRRLKKIPDSENPTKSLLGVMAEYLKATGVCSVITITVSSLYILKPNMAFLLRLYPDLSDLSRVASSISCAIFACNMFFMILILRILITALMNASVQSE